jgi:hypothetical protein
MVFEVKYLKYTLFVLILPGSMKATLDGYHCFGWWEFQLEEKNLELRRTRSVTKG